MNFAFIQHECRVALHCQTDHIQALHCASVRRIPVRRRTAGNEAYRSQITLLQHFLCQAQMTVMDRIERAAQNADGGLVHRLKHQSANIRQYFSKISCEMHCLRTIDYAMII